MDSPNLTSDFNNDDVKVNPRGYLHDSDRDEADINANNDCNDVSCGNLRVVSRNKKLSKLVVDVCVAVEKGEVSKTLSILNLAEKGWDGSVQISAPLPNPLPSEMINQKPPLECHQLLYVFYSLIGHKDDGIVKIINAIEDGEISSNDETTPLSFPLSLRAHVILRALLWIPYDCFSIPW